MVGIYRKKTEKAENLKTKAGYYRDQKGEFQYFPLGGVISLALHNNENNVNNLLVCSVFFHAFMSNSHSNKFQ